MEFIFLQCISIIANLAQRKSFIALILKKNWHAHIKQFTIVFSKKMTNFFSINLLTYGLQILLIVEGGGTEGTIFFFKN